MVIERTVYIPTLALRASEMNGIEKLSGATKDRITPCFLLAPWPNAKDIEKAIRRIEQAFHNRRYILDLDRDYAFSNPEALAQAQFAELLSPDNGYQKWVDFVSAHEWVMPCIQTTGQKRSDFTRQIKAYQEMGRPYCLRIVRGSDLSNLQDVVGALADIGTADFVVILEGGWAGDPLSLAPWFSGLIDGALQALNASVPVTISCTSIPRMFSDYNGRGPHRVNFSNRELVDQIQAQSNRTRVLYGDWGSTRPREQGGVASRPLDRIDYPVEKSWVIFRNKDDGWDFSDAAKALMASTDWDEDLDVWGGEMISTTVSNPPLGINSPQKNVAARVNIHLHRQAFYGTAAGGASVDEEWED